MGWFLGLDGIDRKGEWVAGKRVSWIHDDKKRVNN